MVENRSDVQNILIAELWGIGDLVLMSAILGPLKIFFPDAKITLLCKPHGRELFAHDSRVDRIVAFDFPWTAFRNKYCFWRWDWHGMTEVIRTLRLFSFDACLDARGDPRNHILLGLLKIKKFYRHWRSVRNIHRVKAWAFLLERMKIRAEKIEPKLYISKQEKQWALDFLREISGDLENIVAIHPGARIKIRCWPMDRFEEIIRRVTSKGKKVLFFVEPSGYGESIKDFPGVYKVRVNLREMMALCSCLRLFIGNDGGAMHIAAACGAYVVGIFGPTDPVLFGPYGEGHNIVIRNDVPCRPCFDSCSQNRPWCIEDVTVNEVWSVVEKRFF